MIKKHTVVAESHAVITELSQKYHKHKKATQQNAFAKLYANYRTL